MARSFSRFCCRGLFSSHIPKWKNPGWFNMWNYNTLQVEQQRQEHNKAADGDRQVEKNAIHTILTSNGSPYMNWQSRVMYYTYKQASNPDK